MTREQRALRMLWYWIPGVIGAALLVACIVFGPSQADLMIEAAVDALGGRLIAFITLVFVGFYYIIMANTLDPFWPLRKRLWTEGMMFLAIDSTESLKEPFIWSKQPLPPGTDVSDML